MFMLAVTLPGRDCVCMHSFPYLCLSKCVNVPQVTAGLSSTCRIAVEWVLYTDTGALRIGGVSSGGLFS